jgi:hypothetical protein|tara:strand:+ start:245 stop:724 length:480 start_codon:yes stop_codon:yes gene_type:complete
MRLLWNVIILTIITLKNVFLSLDFKNHYLPELTLLFVYIISTLDRKGLRSIDLVILGFLQDIADFGLPGVSILQNFLCFAYTEKKNSRYCKGSLIGKWIDFSLFTTGILITKYLFFNIKSDLQIVTLMKLLKQIFITILSFPIVYCAIFANYDQRKVHG